MQENPLVSIVIPVYNGSNYMREAIDSALAQTYPNIEILVVNDGSTDDTREIALSYGDRIRYFEKENGGVSTALNMGIREMRGEYFSWLSHDDVYYPDKVMAEINALRESGNMEQAVYCGVEALVMPGRSIVSPFWRKSLFLDQHYKTKGLWAILFCLIYGCELLVPQKYFQEYGLFDENFRAIQDTMKWVEMFHDKSLLYVDRILVQAKQHAQQVGRTYSKVDDERDIYMLFLWEHIHKNDVHGLGIDMYYFYSIMYSQVIYYEYHVLSILLERKLLQLPETICAEEKCRSFEAWLHSFGGDSIYIYCVGDIGQRLRKAFYLRNINVDGIADSNPKKWGEFYDGKRCESPKDISRECLLIVAKYNPDELQKVLVSEGFQHVITYEMICNKMLETPILQSLLKKYLGYGRRTL